MNCATSPEGPENVNGRSELIYTSELYKDEPRMRLEDTTDEPSCPEFQSIMAPTKRVISSLFCIFLLSSSLAFTEAFNAGGMRVGTGRKRAVSTKVIKTLK